MQLLADEMSREGFPPERSKQSFLKMYCVYIRNCYKPFSRRYSSMVTARRSGAAAGTDIQVDKFLIQLFQSLHSLRGGGSAHLQDQGRLGFDISLCHGVGPA